MATRLAFLSLLGAVAAFDLQEYLTCSLCETSPPSGQIEDCCCDVETVDQANNRHFLPILHDLTKRTYFRYFQADLWRSCPFWPEDGQCHNRDCSVCECEEGEIPQCWKEEDAEQSAAADVAAAATAERLSSVEFNGGAAAAVAGAEGGPEDDVGGGATGGGEYAEGAVWTVQDTASPDMQYVNLLRNPEGYTGYAGPQAGRVWQAIYRENCFTGPLDGMCLEERVFYRLLSGLQTSINTHIAMTYNNGMGSRSDLYQHAGEGASGAHAAASNTAAVGGSEAAAWARRIARRAVAAVRAAVGADVSEADVEAYAPGAVVGGGGPLPVAQLVLTSGVQPSVQMYVERIGKHRDRLSNLYFVFLFMVRAVAKAGDLLTSLDYSTGNVTDDAATRALVQRLLSVEIPAVVRGFDESIMFAVRTEDILNGAGSCPPVLHGLDDLHELQHRYLAAAAAKEQLLVAFRDRFRNISRIMDCVGCEKCRLWGKLQFLGLGTALKILFADADVTGQAKGPGGVPPALQLHLSRNEVVALVNVLHRVSMSISAIHVMRDLEAQAKLDALLVKGGGGVLAAAAVVWILTAFIRARRRVYANKDKPKTE